ncbi:MAG TPA: S53 family peptidase [Phenylobacterium sp.]|nr:S53 family peptidase [Phenylobacterium sp.]
MAKRPVPGSERSPLPGAVAVGRTASDQRLEVTVLLRRRDAQGMKARAARTPLGGHMDDAAFTAAYGADPADMEKVASFAEEHDLAIVQSDAGRRTVILSGAVEQFEAAFDVELQDFEYDNGSYRGRVGAVQVPEELAGVVEAVMGLDNRPVAKPHFRLRPNFGARASGAGLKSFTPPQLAKLYGFPAGTGQGQCVALIELGGGYRPADLKAYFSGLGVGQPKVTAIGVDHAANKPTGDPNGPDGEVVLDIEVAGGVAPNSHIVVYFAPNTDAGFLNAITTAAHDTKNKPSVISISWGGPESSWTAQSLAAFDSAFQAAAVMGVTVFVASGDNGSSDGLNDGQAHVDFPASSPHATACGGTRLTASGQSIAAEQVWNDGTDGGAGGGGVSVAFEAPSWQNGLKVKPKGGLASPLAKRGVPDVAADADPESGYEIRVDGQTAVIGGTSAVAPLWAGLVAIVNAASGKRAGLINPLLYAAPAALRDVTMGDNGMYEADEGWDACTGLGSPNGAAVAAALAPPP